MKNLPQNIVRNIRVGIVDYDDTEIIPRTQIPYNVNNNDQYKPAPTFLAGDRDGNYFYITDQQLVEFTNEIVYLRNLTSSMPKRIKYTTSSAHLDVEHSEPNRQSIPELNGGTVIMLIMIIILVFLAFVTSGSNEVAIEAIKSVAR